MEFVFFSFYCRERRVCKFIFQLIRVFGWLEDRGMGWKIIFCVEKGIKVFKFCFSLRVVGWVEDMFGLNFGYIC